MIFEIKLKSAIKIGNVTKDRIIKNDPILGTLELEKDFDMIIISGGILKDYCFEIPVSNCEYIKRSTINKAPEAPKPVQENTEPASKAAPKKKK